MKFCFLQQFPLFIHQAAADISGAFASCTSCVQAQDHCGNVLQEHGNNTQDNILGKDTQQAAQFKLLLLFLTLLCFRLDLVSVIFIEDQSFDFFQTFRLKYLFISQTVHERDHTCHCSAFSVMQWTHKLRLPELTQCPLTLASLFFFLPPHPHLMFFTALLCADLKCLLASLAHSAFICLLHFYLILGGLSSSEGLFLSN